MYKRQQLNSTVSNWLRQGKWQGEDLDVEWLKGLVMRPALRPLALSGWTDSGWAGIATFDLFAPGGTDEVLGKRLVKQLAEQPQTLDALSETLRQPRQTVRQALLGELLKGAVVHDIGTGVFLSLIHI